MSRSPEIFGSNVSCIIWTIEEGTKLEKIIQNNAQIPTMQLFEITKITRSDNDYWFKLIIASH